MILNVNGENVTVPKKIADIALVAVLALAAGGGGSAIQSQLADHRPDPFTGSQGSALETRIEALERSSERKWDKLDAMFSTLHRIETLVAAGTLPELKSRIRELEKQVYSSE